MLPHLDFSIQFIQTTFEQLPASAHVYICNALHHVRPVEAIDHCVFSRNQQIEDRLQQSTFHALRGNDEVCMLEFNF
jgi:branched-subunit amino acid aminotransferase/4-amino-4-deoxychorismate lyase